jgi:hypothetical protein
MFCPAALNLIQDFNTKMPGIVPGISGWNFIWR